MTLERGSGFFARDEISEGYFEFTLVSQTTHLPYMCIRICVCALFVITCQTTAAIVDGSLGENQTPFHNEIANQHSNQGACVFIINIYPGDHLSIYTHLHHVIAHTLDANRLLLKLLSIIDAFRLACFNRNHVLQYSHQSR